jgi:hypothetical protein
VAGVGRGLIRRRRRSGSEYRTKILSEYLRFGGVSQLKDRRERAHKDGHLHIRQRQPADADRERHNDCILTFIILRTGELR